jgi:hypothetical protein
LLKILIFDVLSLTANSPSEDHTNSSAEPNDLFLHARAVYMMYSPSPQTTTNLPLGLCFKLCKISAAEKISHPCTTHGHSKIDYKNKSADVFLGLLPTHLMLYLCMLQAAFPP